MVLIQVYNYLTINKILSVNQFGFCSKHNTEHALFKFDLKTQKIKKIKVTAAALIDLSKAYYTFDSSILLKNQLFRLPRK